MARCTLPRAAAGLAAFMVVLCLWSTGLKGYLLLRTHLLRPPLRDDEPRQLLVVGTQSSGTAGMASSLQQLRLEVEHESSNSAETACRDGTVSWFHGIRFFAREAASAESVRALCRSPGSRTGFDPRIFRNARSCSAEWFWGDCWRKTCMEVVAENWGCARRPGQPCETQFSRSLLQVRHPLRVVESLGVKFCASADARLSADIADLLSALWPSAAPKFRAEGPPGASSCLVALGWYWTLYHESLAGALDSGVLHGWYRVEGSSACEVARLAGFGSAGTARFPPSARAYIRACVDSTPPPRARRTNQRNRGLLHVEMRRFDALDPELARRMRALAVGRFGYALHDEAAPRPRNRTETAGGRARTPRLKLRAPGTRFVNDWRG